MDEQKKDEQKKKNEILTQGTKETEGHGEPKWLSRRAFLHGAGIAGISFGVGKILSGMGKEAEAWEGMGHLPPGGAGKISLFETNDTHGQCYAHPEMFFVGAPNDGSGSNIQYLNDMGGFDRIAGYVRHVKELNGGNALFFDEGDTIHGTYHAIFDEAYSYVQMLNSVGWSATNPGNWETRWGPTIYIQRTKEMNFPTLACNFYDKSTGRLIFPPYKIETLPNGLKVGVIGLASDNIMYQPKIFTDDGTTAVIVTKGIGKNELPRYVNRLKRGGVDLIVVISHLGYEKDVAICTEYVPGIDVILSGHTHDRILQVGNYGGVGVTTVDYNIKGRSGTTLITQAGFSGSMLAQLDVTVKNRKVVEYEYQLVIVDSALDTYKDPAVTQALADLNSEALASNPDLYQVVGSLAYPINRMTVQEDSIGNLICDAYYWAFGQGNNHLAAYTQNGVPLGDINALVTFTNGWRYGRPVLQGDVTQEAVYNMNPANGPMFLIEEITGAELFTIYENKLTEANTRPINQEGGYPPRFKGMNICARLNNYDGTRISQIFIDTEPIDMTRTYRIISSGGQPIPVEYGTRTMLYKADGTPWLAVAVIIEYLKNNPGADARLTNDRLVLI